MKRREYLIGGITTGFCSLAGCAGDSGNGSSGDTMQREIDASLVVPQEVTAGEEWTFSLEVENKTSENITYQPAFEMRYFDARSVDLDLNVSWEIFEWEEVTVQAENTAEFESGITQIYEELAYVDLRLAEKPNEIHTVDVVPPDLNFGESFTAKNGIQMTALNIETTDVVTYDGREESAPDGSTWALAEFKSENVGDERADTPRKSYMELQAGQRQYEYSISDAPALWVGYEATTLEPGLIRDGQVIYKINEEDSDGPFSFIFDPVGGPGRHRTWNTSVRWSN